MPGEKIGMVVVLMESLAGTGHKFTMPRIRALAKTEKLAFDPWVRQWVLYKETMVLASYNRKYRGRALEAVKDQLGDKKLL